MLPPHTKTDGEVDADKTGEFKKNTTKRKISINLVDIDFI